MYLRGGLDTHARTHTHRLFLLFKHELYSYNYYHINTKDDEL